MAKYNRDFLVPYLRDVCSMEMLVENLSKEVNQCKSKVEYYTEQLNRPLLPSALPNKDEYWIDNNDEIAISGCIATFLIGIGICLLLGGGIFPLIGIWALIIGICAAIAAITGFFAEKSYRDRKYNRDVKAAADRARYNKRILSERPENEQSLNYWQQRQAEAKSCLESAETMKDKVYGVNIIAKPYRDKYAAYYLYDFFSTCREDDLEKIINTMLLDDIRRQLRKIIKQNEQIILNQRMQLAMQEASNQRQAIQHREQMKQLIQMESNQELQMDYQNMMLRNQEVTNFFLAADYLRNN